ncbi:MAG: rubrerythrin family protein [Abditibacteriota bacterium]|nr:rubrerythrin family protein [Abditibacteriota bacterium]
MELCNTQTYRNLLTAIAGESISANLYSLYADKAAEEGLWRIADVFRETAAQERVHTEVLYRLAGCDKSGEISLSCAMPSGVSDTRANLNAALREEKYKHCVEYANFSKVARQEGLTDIADALDSLGAAELYHQKRFDVLENMLATGTLFKKNSPVLWRCVRCGYVDDYKKVPDHCPLCGGSRGNFEELMRNLFA